MSFLKRVRHEDSVVFRCSDCGERFPSHNSKKTHIRVHHQTWCLVVVSGEELEVRREPDGLFYCPHPECCKFFKDPYVLQRHCRKGSHVSLLSLVPTDDAEEFSRSVQDKASKRRGDALSVDVGTDTIFSIRATKERRARFSVEDTLSALYKDETLGKAVCQSLAHVDSELASLVTMFPFKDTGSSIVADFPTLVRLMSLCPDKNKTTHPFRMKMANVFIRYLHGDEKLKQEIDSFKGKGEGELLRELFLTATCDRPYNNNLRQFESLVRDRLSNVVRGNTEVHLATGIADVVSPTEVIEVKHIKHWKSALGQIIAYCACEETKHLGKRIHLFSNKPEEEKLATIRNICKEHGVRVTFEKTGIIGLLPEVPEV